MLSKIIKELSSNFLFSGPLGSGKSSLILSTIKDALQSKELKILIISSSQQDRREIFQLEGFFDQKKIVVITPFQFWCKVLDLWSSMSSDTDWHKCQFVNGSEEKEVLEQLAKKEKYSDDSVWYFYQEYMKNKLIGFEMDLSEEFLQFCKMFEKKLLSSYKIPFLRALFHLKNDYEKIQNFLGRDYNLVLWDDYHLVPDYEHEVLKCILPKQGLRIFRDNEGSIYHYKNVSKDLMQYELKKEYCFAKQFFMKEQYWSNKLFANKSRALLRKNKSKLIRERNKSNISGKIHYLYFEDKESQIEYLQGQITESKELFNYNSSDIGLLFRVRKELNEFLQKETRISGMFGVELPSYLNAWIKFFMHYETYYDIPNLFRLNLVADSFFDQYLKKIFECFQEPSDFFDNLKLLPKTSAEAVFYEVGYSDYENIFVKKNTEEKANSFTKVEFERWLNEIKSEDIIIIAKDKFARNKLKHHFLTLTDFKSVSLGKETIRRFQSLVEFYNNHSEIFNHFSAILIKYEKILEGKSFLKLKENMFADFFNNTPCKDSAVLLNWFERCKKHINEMMSVKQNLINILDRMCANHYGPFYISTLHEAHLHKFKKIYVPFFDEDHFPPVRTKNINELKEERKLIAKIFRMSSSEIIFLTNLASWKEKPNFAKELKLL